MSDLLSVFNTLDRTSTIQDMLDLVPVLVSMKANYLLWAPIYKVRDTDPREILAKITSLDTGVIVSADMTCFVGGRHDLATFIHTVCRDAKSNCVAQEIGRAFNAKILPMAQLDTIHWIFI